MVSAIRVSSRTALLATTTLPIAELDDAGDSRSASC
jgi:hypothetical protein